MEFKSPGRLPEFWKMGRGSRISSPWQAPLSLALIQEKDCIAAVICRRGLFKTRIVALVRQPLKLDLDETLAALHEACLEKGYGEAWLGPVKICLPSSEAIFQDFHLPPSSLRKARKTMPLLLDSEIPFGAEQYTTRTTFSRQGGIRALATIVPNSIIAKWSAALQKFDIPQMELSILPWPVIKGLPALKAPCLLFCLCASCWVICAINSRGRPLRIGTLLPGADSGEGALNLARQARLLTADSSFKPETVLVFGGTDNGEIKKAIRELYQLPCLVLGDDLPFSESSAHGRDKDPACMLARSMWTRGFSIAGNLPSFSLKLGRGKTARFSWLIPAAVCLALLGGLDLLILQNILANGKKTEALRSTMMKELRAGMENLPKNASLGRLSAILESRLGELEMSTDNGANHAVISMLENIHKACPKNLKVHLQRLTYDEKHVRLNGTADTYEEIDELKNSISTLPGIGESRIANAAASRDKGRQFVEFELDLTRGGQ